MANFCHLDFQESALIVPISKNCKRQFIYLRKRAKAVINAIRQKSEELGHLTTDNSVLVKISKTGNHIMIFKFRLLKLALKSGSKICEFMIYAIFMQVFLFKMEFRFMKCKNF